MARYFLLLFFLYAPSPAYGCGIGPGPVHVSDYNDARAVFTGKYISAGEQVPGEETGTFYITKWYKGVARPATITVMDTSGYGSSRFTDGLYYVVFAATDDTVLYTDQYNRAISTYVSQPRKTQRDSVILRDTLFLQDGGRVLPGTLYLGYDIDIGGAHSAGLENFVEDTAYLNRFLVQLNNDGLQKFYYDDGRLMAEGVYEDGIPVGLWKYYSFGRLRAAGMYNNGLREGVWVVCGRPWKGARRDYDSEQVIVEYLEVYEHGKEVSVHEVEE